MTSTIIVAEKSGQLGNQLILFSHLIALAEELGIRVVNAPFGGYAGAFSGTHRSAYPTYPIMRSVPSPEPLRSLIFKTTNIYARGARRGYWGRRGVGIIETPGLTPEFDKDLSQPPHREAILGTKRTYLFGWRYRSYGLFHKHADLIRQFFVPIHHQRQISQFMKPLRERFDALIALHIRQGDYENYESGRFFLTTHEYRNLLEPVIEQLSPKRTGVIVFSNIRQDLSIFHPLSVIAGPGDVITDLYCMAQADYIIAVPSTFSRWASFYGQVPLATVDKETRPLELSHFSASPH